MIFSAQEKALGTNWIRKNNDGQKVSEKCRMCGERDESITHVIAKFKNLAQKAYKQRHGNTVKIVHLELYQKFGLVGEVKWYNHKPTSVVQNDRVEILWDYYYYYYYYYDYYYYFYYYYYHCYYYFHYYYYYYFYSYH